MYLTLTEVRICDHVSYVEEFLVILYNSGPRSCLCSKPEACEISEDNEVDLQPDVTTVSIFF